MPKPNPIEPKRGGRSNNNLNGNIQGLLCPLCANPRPIKKHHLLYRHLEEVHVGVSHDCSQCNQRIRGRYHRNDHIDEFHTDGRRTYGLDTIKKRDRTKALFRSQLSNSYFRIIAGTKGDLEEVGPDEQPIPGGLIYRLPYTDREVNCKPSFPTPSSWNSLPDPARCNEQPSISGIDYCPITSPQTYPSCTVPLDDAYQARWHTQQWEKQWPDIGEQFNQPVASLFSSPYVRPSISTAPGVSSGCPTQESPTIHDVFQPTAMKPDFSSFNHIPAHPSSHLTHPKHPLHIDYPTSPSSVATSMDALFVGSSMPPPDPLLFAQPYDSRYGCEIPENYLPPYPGSMPLPSAERDLSFSSAYQPPTCLVDSGPPLYHGYQSHHRARPNPRYR